MATLEVTELPVRKWTQDYKEFLETLIKPESKVGQWYIMLVSCHQVLAVKIVRAWVVDASYLHDSHQLPSCSLNVNSVCSGCFGPGVAR